MGRCGAVACSRPSDLRAITGESHRTEGAQGMSHSMGTSASGVPEARQGAGGRADLGAIVLLLMVTLLVRGSVVFWAARSLDADPDGYRRLAQNLLAHGTFGSGAVPTAYRPPLYPLMLVPCVALGRSGSMAIAVLHLMLAAGTVLITYGLGRRWGLGRFGLLAGVLVVCDPILLNQSTQVMTETPAALLAVACLWALVAAGRQGSASRWALAGALMGLAALCRSTFLVWMALVGVAVAWSGLRGRGGWRPLAAFATAGVLVLLPWVVRNQWHFGRPIVGTTHGGYTLLLANNPSFYAYLRRSSFGEVWDAAAFHADWGRRVAIGSPRAELANDRLAYAEAWRAIRAEPATFAWASLVRVGRLWQLVPHRTAAGESPHRRLARYAVGLWYLAQFALAAAGAVGLAMGGSPDRRLGDRCAEHDQRGWMWGLLLAAALTGVHAVYWSNMRMRAPLVPLLALLAARGVAQMTAPRKRRPAGGEGGRGTA